MASTFSVEIDKKTLDDVRFMLATVKNGAETAVRRAANDTAVTARSETVKKVASRLNLTQKRIRENTDVRKANFGSITAKALILTKPIPLVEFPHITSFVGTSVSVRRSRPAELFRHRFKARMPSGHTGIFERRLLSSGRPAGRLPIDEQAGPGIGNVFHYNDEKALFDEMMTLFQQRVVARAEFILSRA